MPRRGPRSQECARTIDSRHSTPGGYRLRNRSGAWGTRAPADDDGIPRRRGRLRGPESRVWTLDCACRGRRRRAHPNPGSARTNPRRVRRPTASGNTSGGAKRRGVSSPAIGRAATPDDSPRCREIQVFHRPVFALVFVLTFVLVLVLANLYHAQICAPTQHGGGRCALRTCASGHRQAKAEAGNNVAHRAKRIARSGRRPLPHSGGQFVVGCMYRHTQTGLLDRGNPVTRNEPRAVGSRGGRVGLGGSRAERGRRLRAETSPTHPPAALEGFPLGDGAAGRCWRGGCSA